MKLNTIIFNIDYNNDINNNNIWIIYFKASINKSSKDIITIIEFISNNISNSYLFSKNNLHIIDVYLLYIISSKVNSINIRFI